jgi:glycine cleavage system H protein
MKFMSGLKYSKEHEWIRAEGNRAYIGITDYAQYSLGEIVYVELPETDKELESGEVLGVVESVKAASDIYAPLSGRVVEINGELEDNPAKINEDPFGSWIAVLELSDASQLNELMDEDEYKRFCTEVE